jgi:membrane-bound serine protease (ClpP class)
MNDFGIVILVFAVGVIILVAEIFIPSHGILGVSGLGFLGYAVWRAYTMDGGSAYGHIALLTAIVLVPTLAIIGIKSFHKTPIGKLISPANPVADSAAQEALRDLLGREGRTITTLRPVGTCIFDDERVNCVAETGLIEEDRAVVVVGVRGNELEVRVSQQSNGPEVRKA